jgi:hypothetical protein
VFTQIFTLPEREFGKSYLKNFTSVEGIVDVSYSFNEIAGKGCIALSKKGGFTFLNYALMPDVVHTVKAPDNTYKAHLLINIRIEDDKGKTIYQRDRDMELTLDEFKSKDIIDKKAVFEDFAPIIEGKFNVQITFSNKSTEEFYIYKEAIDISNESIPVLVGLRIENINSNEYLPFSTDHLKMDMDPRFLYDQSASLAGIIMSPAEPVIVLKSRGENDSVVEVTNIANQGKSFVFSLPLQKIKPGNYDLCISVKEKEIYRKTVSILSFRIDKPLAYWKIEPASSAANYTFLIGQEYLNNGDADAAIAYFSKLPESLLNSATLPIIARAHYIKRHYEKVVELLEKNVVEKNYSTLHLLANSSLKLKKLREAAEYFERLRQYGDTIEINNALGAIYYSLGEREKAKIYWDRAKKIEKSSQQ